ncbi:MAG: TetR/AcrR family transcriptional regulator [Puniceicoccales bacterium]
MPKKAAAKSRAEWIDAYLDHLLEQGEPPASVRKFAREQGATEKVFYSQFASFDALEGSIWKALISETVDALHADPEYADYPVQQKLAAFYFTFLDGALDQRSFLLLRFPGVQLVTPPHYLNAFRDAFLDYIKPVLDEARDGQEIPKRGELNKVYPGLLYAQLLFIIDFWLKDESEQFQRTDALVEKSIKLAFDVIGAQVVDSAFDLVRFLAGEMKKAG